MTTTYTVAQAIATTASGILVVDTAVNIATNLTNTSLVSRVSLFSMSASGNVAAWEAAALAAIGTKFSTAGYTLTIRDTVAQLTASNNAAGLTIGGALVGVQDNAANILAAITNPIIRNANSVAITANATLTLAQLLSLETLSNLSAAGMTLTLADSAANLLALTPAETKPTLTVFQVSISSTVTAQQAVTLEAMSHFSVVNSATLTVSDTLANLAANAVALYAVFVLPGTTVTVSDTLNNLLTQTASFRWYEFPNVSVSLSNSGSVNAAQAATLAALPNFSVASGKTLTIADTVSHLVTLTGGQAAIASTIALSGNDTASVAQLAILAALPHFVPGHTLTVDDRLINLATLTIAQHALVSAETIDDTVTNLLAAQPSALSGASVIVAELDGTTLDAAQAVALAALASNATLTLHANSTASTLTVSDTAQQLSAAAASLATLEADGSVTVVTTSYPDRTILTASAAYALVESGTSLATATLAVADTGSALSAVAGVIFGQGFEAITVTSGSFAGTMAQLLDLTLHFAGSTTAMLNADAIASVAQALDLAALPGFSRGADVTLVVLDSITGILAAAAELPSVATSILANDTEIVSAANAATLATLTGFSLHGNYLLLNDTAAAIAAAPAGAITLASTVDLTSDARISEAVALQFVAMGLKFSPNGFFITVADTAANLEALANDPTTLATVNGWNGEAVLSANASVAVADAAALSLLTGFNAGRYQLTIGDSASNLLGASNTVLALAYQVQLSQASTVSAAGAESLEAMHNFSANGYLAIADTPAALAAMPAAVATPANGVSLAVESYGRNGNMAGYVIDATQFDAMMALPHFSLSGFAGTVAISDTAATLAAMTPSLQDLSESDLSHIITSLSASATVPVATAEALYALPGFSLGTGVLTISDTTSNLETLNAGTAALASAIEVSTPVTVDAATAATLAALHDFTADINPITITDTPANLAAMGDAAAAIAATVTIQPYSVPDAADYTLNADQFLALAGKPVSFTGFAGPLHVLDTATDLAELAGSFIAAGLGSTIAQSRIVLTTLLSADATVDAEVMSYLVGLPGFSVNTHTLVLQDTPTALIDAFSGFVPYASDVKLAANGTAWVVSAQLAAQLAAIGPLNAGPAGMVVSDTVTNLLTAPYASGVEAATATTLDQDSVVSVAQAEALHALPDFSRGSYTLVISDTAGAIATLDAGTSALASSIVTIGGSSSLSVDAFNSLVEAADFSGSAGSLTVSDSATALLTLVGSGNLTYVGTTILNASATLSAANAEHLSTLPNLLAGDDLTISDTAADLVHVTGGGSTPDDWAGELVASAVTLSANATITAAQANQLALLGSRFSVGSYTITIADSAAELLSPANAAGLVLAGALTLSGDETALSAAAATQLAGLSHFSKGGYHVTVSDTAADLSFAGNAAGLALADHVQLSQASSMTVAAAEALIGMTSFQINNAAPLTIDDTLTNLLGLATASLAHNNSVLAATPIELSADAVASVAQMQALAALAQYSTFDLNGNTITVEDSGRHLASFTADSIAVPAAYVMIGDATLDAAQAGVLAAQHVQTGDNALIVADTPAALLGLSGAVNALATGLELSSAATATAAQATGLEVLAAAQRFTTGGYALTVTGSASALLGLSPATQQLATTLALSESGDLVSVDNLVQLTELGSKFSLNAHTLTVSDSAAQLASLNGLETALVSASVLNAGATVNTTTATELAALPDFSLGNGVTLIVQGSYAALEALPGAITSIATLELTGASQTLTASEAAALAGLSNFTPGADLMVQDTIAELTSGANTGWHNVATGGYIVTDSISNLLNNAGSMLLTDANSVTLLGDAQVDAATFATLAAMTNFSRGSFALTVEDSALAIAANATAIGLLASNAIIDSSAPVSAAQAEALAALNTAHMLSFTGGVSLAVQDSLAQLTSISNAAGLALASTVTVLGTGVQLVTATAHGWGSINPYYELNASGDITGLDATTLQGLGGHFLTGGYTLTVVDGAGAIVSNASAIEALGLLAQVSDSVSDVAAEVTQLGDLGSTLQSITLTDSSSVSAGTVAALVPLAAKLVAPAITVSDTAASVDANLAALETLGTHVSSITVSDSAAHVADYAAALSALGSKLDISLSDTTPVTLPADVAAGLVPVDAHLGGTTIDVSDTGAHIAADAATLAELGSVLGTVTLSDGTALDAPSAAALAQIDSHLGNGVKLSVTDGAAAIDAAAIGLATLVGDGRISSITSDSQTVANVLAYGTTLAALGATATIDDSATHVSANLDALELLSGNGGVVTQITLNDGGTPDIALSLQQITSDADVLGLIVSTFKYAISDTGADIAADLGAGGLSRILTLGSAVDTIAVSDSGTLTLTAATLLATGVDDSGTSALTKLTGGVSVAATGVTVADFAGIDLLSVAPGSFAVADSSGDIATDLERGGVRPFWRIAPASPASPRAARSRWTTAPRRPHMSMTAPVPSSPG